MIYLIAGSFVIADHCEVMSHDRVIPYCLLLFSTEKERCSIELYRLDSPFEHRTVPRDRSMGPVNARPILTYVWSFGSLCLSQQRLARRSHVIDMERALLWFCCGLDISSRRFVSDHGIR